MMMMIFMTTILAVTKSFAAFGRSGRKVVVFYELDKMQKFLLVRTD